jgi:drug/metabolite transporter (DMT)-like permease
MQSGVFLILLSMSLTPLGDALSKQLGQTQSPMFIVFLRYFLAGLMALALVRVTGTRLCLPARDRLGFVCRTGLVMAAMSLLIVALSKTALATAIGGFLIAPIIAMLVAVLFYGERLTTMRLAGALVSFLGALLILEPTGGIKAGILYALAGGVCLGLFLATTGRADRPDNPIAALALQCLLGAAMLLPFAWPGFGGVTSALLLPALSLGFITAATHFLTVAAYQRCPAATLAPFFYFSLIAALFIGLIWFREIPSWLSLAGLGLILLGGLVSLLKPGWSFRRLLRHARKPAQRV